MTKIGDAKRKIHGMITGKPDNFSWVIDSKLAGSAIPTSKEEVDWTKPVSYTHLTLPTICSV